MRCPTCKENGEKSRVFPGPTTTTLMSRNVYYDGDGNYHSHDPNTKTTKYTCSNGHEWTEEITPKCPTCDPEEEA